MKWLAYLSVLVVLGGVVACGSGGPGSGSAPTGKHLLATGSADSESGCPEPWSAAEDAIDFARAIADSKTGTLRQLLGGRFEWFSVNGWPAGGTGTLVARSPQKTLTLIARQEGFAIELQSLALAASPGAYVNVAYQGAVLAPDRPGGSSGALVGKAAINCDGTVRVWSMAVRSHGEPSEFAVCEEPAERRREGVAVCAQS